MKRIQTVRRDTVRRARLLASAISFLATCLAAGSPPVIDPSERVFPLDGSVPSEIFLDLLAFASDADGDPLVCAPPTASAGTLAELRPCVYTYQPDDPASFAGDTVTYTVNDGSSLATGTIIIGDGGSTFVPMAAGLTAVAVSSTEIRLSWFNDLSAHHFEVWGGTNPSSLAVLAPNVTAGTVVVSWSHTGLLASTTYHYQVALCTSATDCAFSPTVSATTPASGGGANQPPVVMDDLQITIDFGGGQQRFIPYTEILANDFDPDGDPITVASVLTCGLDPATCDDLDTAYGTLTLLGDGILYTRDLGQGNFSNDAFEYTITDGLLESERARVTITVVNLPDPVVANDDPNAASTEDGVAVYIPFDALLDNDTGGLIRMAPLHFTRPEHGRLDLCCNDDLLDLARTPVGVWYTPDEGFAGQDDFWYAISGISSWDTAKATVTVTDSGPDATIASHDVIPVLFQPSGPSETVIAFVDLLRNDRGNLLQLDPALQASGATRGILTIETPGLDPSAGPAPVGYEGAFHYQATTLINNLNSSYIYDLVGALGPANAFAVFQHHDPAAHGYGLRAVNDLLEVQEGERLTVSWGIGAGEGLIDNDLDLNGDMEIAIDWLTQPQHGHIAPPTSITGFIYEAPRGWVGADHFTYSIEIDSAPEPMDWQRSTARVVVLVHPGTPLPADDLATTSQETPIVIDVLANDNEPNGDPLTIIDVSQPAGGYAAIDANGFVVYAPAPGFTGTDSFTYDVRDPHGNQAQATVTVTVTVTAPVNTPPVAIDDDAEVTEAFSTVVIDVLANDSDADGDPLSVLSVGQTDAPVFADVTILADGTVRYQLINENCPPQAECFDTFDYVIGDGQGGTAQATVTVRVATGGGLIKSSTH